MTERIVTVLDGEYWWGGVVNCGFRMPLDGWGGSTVDPCGGADLDQSAPLFLSSAGRFLWSARTFSVQEEEGRLRCRGEADILLSEGHGSLRGAYLAACGAHFPFAPQRPDERFFSVPQYNTWIELATEQTQERILAYAEGILANGMPAGILMIDEGWQEEYGVFEFNRRKIPDPEGMIARLHEMGFSVMLWVTPNVACAGPRFKELRQAGWLVRSAGGEVAVREWWNGYSAVLDMTNPAACEWLNGQLHDLMERYGADGFKFDAGDCYFYRDDDMTYAPVTAREHTRLFNRFGEGYALNEFRSAWNCGGRPIVARLQDKMHSWDTSGLASLIPHTILQGLLGYAYCCPDMVGGGDIGSFDAGQTLDGELFVRWAQASACMGMMQMSISPWRVLDEAHSGLVVSALRLHAELSDRITALADHASCTGEPIVRHMAYVFPGEGLETIGDQFMLGDDMLVCPVLEKGAKTRKIRLPGGLWKAWRGEMIEGGGEITLPVGLEDIPRLIRIG